MALDDAQLSALIAQETESAVGYIGGEITQQRANAMKYYFGEPFGNEVEGRSQVVSTDVADTIEWILPSMLRIFTGGDDVVQCTPENEGDEASAQQATEYLNWIFERDNPGFVILYQLFKDALLQKNGFAKVWWEVRKSDEVISVKGVPDDSFALAQEDPDIEILTETSYPDPASMAVIDPAADAARAAGLDGAASPGAAPASPTADAAFSSVAPAPSMLHDYTYRVKTEKGRVAIANIPPEEFLINRSARTIHEARFVGHRRRRSIADLIAEGFDRKTIEDLPSDEDPDLTQEAIVRKQFADTTATDYGGDESVRDVWVTECYIRIDWDGDGIAEMRKITASTSAATILKNEEWHGPAPFISLTPIIIPHRFWGMSIADLVMDLQLIKSTIMRQMLDNMYFSLNQRHIISDQVNLDDYLTSRPGGAVRLKNGAMPSQGHILPIETPMFLGQAFPLLEYIDGVRENRTGITRYNQGTDANTLNKTASGVNQIMTAAQQRIDLIARIFAETGVKDLFWLMLECVSRYQDKPRMIRLEGKWTPIDPRGWQSKFDMTVNVGLGTGNKDIMVGHLMQILNLQMQAVQFQQGIQGPLVTQQNLYNSAAKLTNAIGYKSPELFFSPPGAAQPPPPPPDPKMAAVQTRAQLGAAKLQLSAKQHQDRLQFDQQKATLGARVDLAKTAIQAGVDVHGQNLDTHASMHADRMAAGADILGSSLDAAAQDQPQVADLAKTLQEFMQQQKQRDDQQSAQIATLMQMAQSMMGRPMNGGMPNG